MTRTIKPPYQLIEFSGGGLALGGYAQLKGFLPPVTLLKAIGGLRLSGRTSALTPVGDRGGLRIGGRSRVLSLIGQYSPALARFGSTTGMTEVVNSPNSQGSQYLPDIGFPFPLYGSTYQSNIAISSNWALLFGFSALAATDISRTVPGQAFLIAASRARSWDRVLVKSDNSFSYRIRFETQISFGSSPVYNTFEVTIYSDGSIQLVCGTSFDFYGYFGAPRVRSLTKGDNVSYADFDRPYPYAVDTDSVNAGVEISFVFTPDDTAANSHTVRVGSYPVLAPKISRGGLLIGGYAIADPNLAFYTSRSFGGLRLGGQAFVPQPPKSIGGLRLGGRSSVIPVLAFSTAIAALQDSTGMTQVVSSFGDDAGQYLPNIGFDFPIYGLTYRSNIAIGSNWYLLFGFTNTAFSGLSRTVPGKGLLFGAADRSWQNVYFKAESGFCRIRFEGRGGSSGTSYTAIFQIKLFYDGAIELAIGIGAFYNPLGITPVQTLTKGDSITYTDFTVPAGSTAQSDFASTAVLTSLVFRPVDAIGSSHTVQVGSYLPSASAGLSGAIVQPQILAGALSVGIAPTGLNGAISQPQTLTGGLIVAVPLIGNISQSQSLSGSLVVGRALSAPINQPQTLTGSLNAAVTLTGLINQPQTIAGSLSIGNALIGGVTQSQNLAGALSVAAALAAPITQPQVLTGIISTGVVIAGAINQTQSITGLLLVSKTLVGGVSQPQVLTGSATASSGLNAPINQPQTLTGSLSIGNALIGGATQLQNLAGALNVSSALSASITQPQAFAGSVSLGIALIGSVTQSQTLSGSLVVISALSAPINQPQTIAGSLSVAVSLSGIASQPQVLVGSLSVAVSLSGITSQPQALIGGLSVTKSLVSNISQPQALIGGLSVTKSLVSNISQPQALIGALLSSVPLAFSSAIATLQDSTGMTQVVSSYGDDVGQYLPNIGFDFPIYGSTYRTNISVGSNWYLLFGLTSIAYLASHTVPGRGLLFGATDRSWQNVYFKAESGFCRIRFEGRVDYQASSSTAIFQIKLFADGTIELTIGIGCFYAAGGFTSLTKGDGTTYTDFTVPAGSTAQSDFTSTAVLTSLVFRPVDTAGSSHTVATGSYS